jgi:acetyl-CoA C-acetyltransferase
MADLFIVPGLRTPFTKAGAQYASVSALQSSAPVAEAMTHPAQPDLLIWGQVIPDPTVSNLAREVVFAADLDPEIPAFSDLMACSTSRTPNRTC